MMSSAVALLAIMVVLSDMGEIYSEAPQMGIFRPLFFFFLLLSLQAVLASATLRPVTGNAGPVPRAHMLAVLLLVSIYVSGLYGGVVASLERYAYTFLLTNFGPGAYTYATVLVSTVALAVLAADLVARTVHYEAGRGSLLVAAVPPLIVVTSVLLGPIMRIPHLYVDWYIYAAPLVALASPLSGLVTRGVSRPLYPLSGLVLRLPSGGSSKGLVSASVLLGSAAVTVYNAFLLLGQRWDLASLWQIKYVVFIPLLLGYAAALRHVRAVTQTLLVCSNCGRATLSYLPKCQHCGMDPV